MESSKQIEIFLLLGFDLTSAYARGQDPDPEFENRWVAFRKQVSDSDAFKEKMRQEQIKKWREEREAADAKKAADAEKAAESRKTAGEVWNDTSDPWATSSDDTPF